MPFDVGPTKPKFPGMSFDPNQMMGPQMPRLMPDQPMQAIPPNQFLNAGPSRPLPFMGGGGVPMIPQPKPQMPYQGLPQMNPTVPGGGRVTNRNQPQPGMMNRFRNMSMELGPMAGNWLMNQRG